MIKHKILTIVMSAYACYAYAQEQYVVDDTIRGEAIDMPEGMFVTEEDLMGDYFNRTGLTPGSEQVRTLSYDDSLIVSRLSRIPTTIEMPLNNVTRKYIDTYSNRFSGSVSVMLGAANFYLPIFEEALERYDLPLELKYLPVIESALRPSATSRVGAAGLWQFMPATGKRYGLEINTLVDERRDPIKSSDAAARYLRDLYDMFGDWGLAIAAYNCGEGNIQKAIIRSGITEGADYWSVYNRLPRETRGYVPAFIAANYIMTYYCEHGIVPREATLPMSSDTVIVTSDVKLDRIASVCGISSDALRALNPQYRRDIVPANYAVCLPSEAIEPFLTYEDSIYNGDISGLRRTVVADLHDDNSNARSKGSRNSSARGKTVSVKKGDTLSGIAKRNGTTVTKIMKLNGMKSDRLSIGQKIRVK